MDMIRQVPASTGRGIALFAAAAALLALTSARSLDQMLVQLVLQFPLLMIFAGIFLLVINLFAAAGACIFRQTAWLAGLIGAILAWIIAEGPSSFAGLGYGDALLRPAYALAAAIPWLFAADLPRARQ